MSLLRGKHAEHNTTTTTNTRAVINTNQIGKSFNLQPFMMYNLAAYQDFPEYNFANEGQNCHDDFGGSFQDF